jgi:hypothetical protein
LDARFVKIHFQVLHLRPSYDVRPSFRVAWQSTRGFMIFFVYKNVV